MTIASRAADRRTLRTRRALRDALLSLLPERGWDDLSVQDICDRADIGRSTFYAHFPTKEELLVQSLSDLRQLLLGGAGELGAQGAAGTLAFMHGLVDHIHSQKRLCRSIFGRRSGHVVQMRFREMVTQLVAEDLAIIAPAGWQRDAATHFISGALVEVLAWLVNAEHSLPVEEVEQYFLRLTLPALAELAGSPPIIPLPR